MSTNATNNLINALCAQARDIDAEYAEECLEAANTNLPGTTDEQRLVRLLVGTAFTLNASGLADGPTIERFQDYTNP